MEIYLKFAENKAIMEKSRGSKKKASAKKNQAQKPRGCEERSPRSRAAVFGLYRLSLGSCLSESSRLLEAVLTHAAQGALKILRYLAPGRTGGDAALRVWFALLHRLP